MRRAAILAAAACLLCVPVAHGVAPKGKRTAKPCAAEGARPAGVAARARLKRCRAAMRFGASATATAPRPGEPPGSAPRDPLPRRLAVDLKEFSVYPSRNPVAAGEVEFSVTNFGEDPHDLSIRAPGGVVVSSTYLESRTGTPVTVKLAPGSYTLFCSLYDHEALGMSAPLSVE